MQLPSGSDTRVAEHLYPPDRVGITGKLKQYISAAALLFVGIVAVATTIFVVFPTQQPLATTTTPSPESQSAFITSTTSVGEATVTEILVNTAIQFPIGDRMILPSSLSNSVEVYALIILLCLSMLIVGLSLSRHA